MGARSLLSRIFGTNHVFVCGQTFYRNDPKATRIILLEIAKLFLDEYLIDEDGNRWKYEYKSGHVAGGQTVLGDLSISWGDGKTVTAHFDSAKIHCSREL